tara:strand:- start:7760 stop:8494 length:735 start_codon:yes stop_codon:yes gene_type:complete
MNINQIAIVIPFYNEVNRFNTIDFCEFAIINLHIDWYFINDGSTDTTQILLEKLQTSLPKINICIISFEENKGKAEAVRNGLLTAYKYKYSHLGFIDGDLQIPLNQVVHLHEALKLETMSIALSTRNFEKDFKYFNFRSVISYSLSLLNKKILNFNTQVIDSQCGCKLFCSNLVPILFERPFISRWLFDIEILLRLRDSKNFCEEQIKQIKLNKLNRSQDSNIRIFQNLNLISDLFKINSFYNR